MWDLDGVVTSWVDTFYPWLCSKLDLTPTEWIEWHHYTNHGISLPEFRKLVAEYASEGGFASQIVASDASEAVKQIRAAGHTQHIVTDRPSIAWADTEWWIDTHLPEIDTLTLDANKAVFKEYGPPTFYALDDRVENVESMRKRGIFAYLITRPWNVHSDLPRVLSLKEFTDIVCD
jgi:hypothetical protein